MSAFDPDFEHERLEVVQDPATGVRAIVAIHSTALGPAMGGLRLHSYNSLDEAISDALRLAEAMTMKNAAAGLDLGGGKAVLIDDGGWADPAQRAERMELVGRIIDGLGGSYITAEDVGTSPQDMTHIARSTVWVGGRPIDRGGRGDPSPFTARTVFGAIEVAAGTQLHAPDLAGVQVGVQGVGHVGAALVSLLCESGADVTITDVDAARAARVARTNDVTIVEPAGFIYRAFDVLAPCAFGRGITSEDVPRLRCLVVAGAANNVLADASVADELAARGILYVPDFLANCGGIIHVAGEVRGFSDAVVNQRISDCIARTAATLAAAREQGLTPWRLAVEQAGSRLAMAPRPSAEVAA